MEIQIASPNEEEKMKIKQYQAQIANVPQPEQGIAGQMGDMVKQRAMEGALNTGQKMATSGVKPYMQKMINAINPAGSAGAGAVAGQAATNAALANAGLTGGAEIALAGQSLAPSLAATGATGAGMGAGMAALGTAVPYIGAGLIAGKALGLFNQGGQVGPLSTQYHAKGGMPEGYNYKRPRYSSSQGVDEANLRAMQDRDALETAVTEQMLDNPFGYYFSKSSPIDYFIDTPYSYDRKADDGMSKEQAMALMNNQPEINFPDPEELLLEMSMPTPRPSVNEMYLYNNPNDASMISEGYDSIVPPYIEEIPQYKSQGGSLQQNNLLGMIRPEYGEMR